MIDESVIIAPEPIYRDLIVRQGESVETFFHITTTECRHCYSLQSCIGHDENWCCADWRACQDRQKENRLEAPAATLTDADITGLLERMETQQADMERLKRIEAAALVFVQASELYANADYSTSMVDRMIEMDEAAIKLVMVVKGGK